MATDRKENINKTITAALTFAGTLAGIWQVTDGDTVALIVGGIGGLLNVAGVYQIPNRPK